MDQQRQVREQIRQRRGSVSEPIPATFDWHHAIRIEGTPPPSYVEAKELPPIDGEVDGGRGSGEQSSSKRGVENAKEGEARAEGMDIKRSPIHANGVNVTSPAQSSQDVTVVQVEDRSEGSEQQSSAQGGTRTFATSYTDFDSAQRSS